MWKQRRGAPEFSGEMIGWVHRGFSVGSHEYSWVLSGASWVVMGSQRVLGLCIFGFSGGSQAGTPPLCGNLTFCPNFRKFSNFSKPVFEPQKYD